MKKIGKFLELTNIKVKRGNNLKCNCDLICLDYTIMLKIDKFNCNNKCLVPENYSTMFNLRFFEKVI